MAPPFSLTPPARLLLALALVACSGTDSGKPPASDDTGGPSTTTPTEVTDLDADGYSPPEDCDDDDATVFPGASEQCDGRDENCDGNVDEGLAVTAYPDADGDSFGEAAGALVGCDVPDGYVLEGNDCDDDDPSAWPGAPEACTDAEDRDCDGLVSFEDVDGDGFAACEDCDDDDPSSWPGAPEVAGDGVDQDCDGVTCAPGPAGAIAIWRGNGDFTEEVGGRDGTASAGVGFVAGVVGEAIDIPAGGIVTASEAGLPMDGDDRTVVAWVRLDQSPPNEAIFVAYGNHGNFEQTFGLGTTGTTPFFSQWGDAVVGPELVVGQWYLFGVTTSGDDVRLYLDGALVATGTIPIHTQPGAGFTLGSIPRPYAEGRALDGQVDEVIIWDRVLGDDEMAQLYAIGADGTCP